MEKLLIFCSFLLVFLSQPCSAQYKVYGATLLVDLEQAELKEVFDQLHNRNLEGIEKLRNETDVLLLYAYQQIRIFEDNAESKNPYPHYENANWAVEKVMADNQGEVPFTAISLSGIIDGLKVRVDRLQKRKAKFQSPDIESQYPIDSTNRITIAKSLINRGEFVSALRISDTILTIDSCELKPLIWYMRGCIFKELFKNNRLLGHGDGFRERAIQSFEKAITLDTSMKYEEDLFGFLRSLANTFYNDAALNIDTLNLDASQRYFNQYIRLASHYKFEDSTALASSKMIYNLTFANKLSHIMRNQGHDTTIAAKIDSIYTCILEINPKNRTVQYNAYANAKNDQMFRSHLMNSLKSENKANLAEAEANKAESVKRRTQTYALAGASILMLFFGGFAWYSYQRKRKDHRLIKAKQLELERQKRLLEEKNKEITDSIIYSRRIQKALLPTSRTIEENLPESFVLYKPKDIIAGDFYWLERKGEKVLFAAADCTGHGVPGAMVSVICNNGLNRSVREDGLTDPGKILDRTRQIVIDEFSKSDENIRDGMDVALCSLEKGRLQYSGAHNPLWVIRSGEVLETKADKQPIGNFQYQRSFTTHEFLLEKNDTVYLFSDGFADQFGGEKGKKLKSRAFKEILLGIQNYPMKEQRIILDEAFEKWKGEMEQIDDVCVFGVRI